MPDSGSSFKMFDSHGEFTLDTSDFARSMAAIHNGSQQIIRESAAIVSGQAKMQSAVSGGAQRIATSWSIADDAIRKGVMAIDGLDTSAKKALVGLTNMGSSLAMGLGMGVIPGLAMAAAAGISSLFQTWQEEVAEAARQTQEAAKRLENLREIEARGPGVEVNLAAATGIGAMTAARQATEHAREDAKAFDAAGKDLKAKVDAAGQGSSVRLFKVAQQELSDHNARALELRGNTDNAVLQERSIAANVIRTLIERVGSTRGNGAENLKAIDNLTAALVEVGKPGNEIARAEANIQVSEMLRAVGLEGRGSESIVDAANALRTQAALLERGQSATDGIRELVGIGKRAWEQVLEDIKKKNADAAEAIAKQTAQSITDAHREAGQAMLGMATAMDERFAPAGRTMTASAGFVGLEEAGRFVQAQIDQQMSEADQATIDAARLLREQVGEAKRTNTLLEKFNGGAYTTI